MPPWGVALMPDPQREESHGFSRVEDVKMSVGTLVIHGKGEVCYRN